MVHNIGNTDRIVRIIVGAIIMALGIIYQSYWGWLAVIPFGTAALGWCPVYQLLGWNPSHKTRNERKWGST